MIDTDLFAAGGDGRPFTRQVHIDAPVDAVYAAWTDPRVFVEVYGAGRAALRANIELRIGGRYEWLWDGETGSNGCQVLSFIPNRLLSFSWNAPPDQPQSRALRTWVVVEFAARAGGGTDLTLTHLGFGSAPHWAETRDYFQTAWASVLARFKEVLEG
jgi:uncharacterized protein YndB with AHSA1/START domain